MTAQISYKISGMISGIEPLDEGYTRVTIQSIDESYREIKVVFFKRLDAVLNGRVLDYQEEKMPNKSLTQIITGEGIGITATTDWSLIEEFRNRGEFIPRQEIEY
jgi:hypothetical protein